MSLLRRLGTDNQAELVLLAAAELQAGGAVILPTDTVYGLATLPAYTDLLFELKQRPSDKAVAILIGEPEDAIQFFEPCRVARELIQKHWPGALTIVQDGYGVRCADHGFVRALTKQVGPIATTSANLSGEPTPETAIEAAAAFSDVQLVIDGGQLQMLASTVIEVTQNNIKILRQGSVQVEAAKPTGGGG